MSLHTVNYGSTLIEYELQYVQRKTLGITVDTDKRVIVHAPVDTVLDEVEAKVKKKGRWILKQQQDFDEYLPQLPPRRYVSGESHLYLGKHYRLKVIEDADEGVKLYRGKFILRIKDATETKRKKQLMTTWYRQHAEDVFSQRLEVCFPKIRRYGIALPELKILTMEKRWGSCTVNGSIILNSKLIQTPKHCIDYVIIHELAHLKERDHNSAYYRLLEKLMPDWQNQRKQLNGFKVA